LRFGRRHPRLESCLRSSQARLLLKIPAQLLLRRGQLRRLLGHLLEQRRLRLRRLVSALGQLRLESRLRRDQTRRLL
jgi:hypothetical protein